MITKLRFVGEYFLYYLKRYLVFLIVGITIGSLIFFQRNNLLKLFAALRIHRDYIGLEGQYTKNNLPLSVTNLLSFGLATGSPAVNSLDIRDNNKTYIFKLNTNLFWHNGTRLTAYDLEAKYSDIQFKAVSTDELRIELKDAFSPISTLLNKPLFLPKTLIGLGKYQLKNITYQEGNIKQLTLQSDQNLKTFRFYANETDLINAFKLGSVDEIQIGILPQGFEQWNNTKISQQITTNKYTAIFLNTDKLAVKTTRQALAYATPKTKDKNERCFGPISPLSWAYNPLIKEYYYNPTRAKELLDKNTIENFKLLVGDRRLLSLAEEIAANWKKILNINVSISSLNNQPDTTDYDGILTYGFIPEDPDQYLYWHSTQTKNNITHLNNSRIDKLLEEGRTTFDQIERKNIYIDFQKFLLEESPAIFLKFPTIYTITRVK